MFLKFWFWLLCALVLLPLPFKVYQYVKGKDESPTIVKWEEIFNAVFLAIGLTAFYGYLNNEHYLFPAFWIGWLITSVVLSIVSMFWSPKLRYAANIMGKSKVTVMSTIGVLFNIPLYYVVYQYAALA